ncbi:MAG: PQQ-binding-like beta-propeller repeat protein [Sedimentisphaerales bacterium]|nr:PQQ-binding-like beta-propeller repeat protein [Sedimentisphaerales bacterium]
MRNIGLQRIVSCGIVLSLAPVGFTADWPQFRGIHRDGKSPETNLLQEWPEGGPKMLWQVDGNGDGWSSAAIAKGRIYITGKIGREGTLFCFDLDGKPVWKSIYGPEWTRSYPGSRTTPTVNEGKLYLMSGQGVVYCHDAETGTALWSRDVFTEFDGVYPSWGISECLFIDGDNVIATPGGKKASIVALNKITGEPVWTCSELTEPSGYGNPQLIRMDTTRILVQMLKDHVAGIDADTGMLLWTDSFDDYHTDRNRIVNPNVPICHDGRIYTTSGYNNGGAMLQLSSNGKRITRLWTDTTLDVHHGNVVLVDGYLYGANWTSNGSGNWACIRWDDGKVMYDHDWNGNKGCIIYADGMLYCWAEKSGELALVPVTPDAFRPASVFTVTQGKGMFWAHPSISEGRLYLRHGEYLMCYDIAER